MSLYSDSHIPDGRETAAAPTRGKAWGTEPAAFEGFDVDALAGLDRPRYLGDLQVCAAIVGLARRVQALELESVRLRGELEARP